MNATDDEDYMRWWNSHGDMAEPEIEYRAWEAGRAFQQRRPTTGAVDFAVCTCSTRPTHNTLQIDPACPVHPQNH